MNDAKGIIPKQKKCRWHITTIKAYSNISRFKLSKDKFCNLEYLVCHKLYKKSHSITYYTLQTTPPTYPKL